MKRKGMQEELRMKNYELRWGKSPPRSKVLAQSAAVFSATPSPKGRCPLKSLLWGSGIGCELRMIWKMFINKLILFV